MGFDHEFLKLKLLYYGKLDATKTNLMLTTADKMLLHNRLQIKNNLFFHLIADISLLCYRKFDKYNFENEN
jgi:hypothetical protein